MVTFGKNVFFSVLHLGPHPFLNPLILQRRLVEQQLGCATPRRGKMSSPIQTLKSRIDSIILLNFKARTTLCRKQSDKNYFGCHPKTRCHPPKRVPPNVSWRTAPLLLRYEWDAASSHNAQGVVDCSVNEAGVSISTPYRCMHAQYLHKQGREGPYERYQRWDAPQV